MKSFSPLLKLCVVTIFSVVLFSCSGDDDGIYFEQSTAIVETTNAAEYSAIESEILTLVNKHRASKGLTSLTPLNIISNVADGHTNYMIEAGKISHDNFPMRSQTLVKNANAKLVGENVAYGYYTAEDVVNGWLNSEDHRAIIEKEDYTHFGISTEACKQSGRNYFTQIFIKK
jgi:uncharacterized protein YkwD